MNVLTDDIFRVYRKFLFAAFGSAMLSSIYTLVDAAVVVQHHGPLAEAAVAAYAVVSLRRLPAAHGVPIGDKS